MSAFIDEEVWPEIGELYKEKHIDTYALIVLAQLLGELEERLGDICADFCVG